ncbi:MAG: SDR family NAD(P)-dependent oxidoreductase [Bacteroidales bacterium]|nr:SDR family NAD(P)-dependent oxidoreductase [Bacteroidales bacterium]
MRALEVFGHSISRNEKQTNKDKMKKAIIVGATSGIGRELAKLLTKNGCKVGITGRRTELLNEIKKENPNAYAVKSPDVTDTKNAIEKLEEIDTWFTGGLGNNITQYIKITKQN